MEETQAPDKFYKVKYHFHDDEGNFVREEIQPVKGPYMPNSVSLHLLHPERPEVVSVEKIDEAEFNDLLPKNQE